VCCKPRFQGLHLRFAAEASHRWLQLNIMLAQIDPQTVDGKLGTRPDIAGVVLGNGAKGPNVAQSEA